MSAGKPRLGFVGVGWIGLDRMKAVLAAEAGQVVAVCDPDPNAAARAKEVVPGAALTATLTELLEHDVDGVVIATPSAMHAEQTITALEAGAAVFCQKPLGRDAVEVARMVDAARIADRRLGVDLSYRHTAALQALRDLVTRGELGHVHALDLTFHNAYGPDKAWFRDPTLSGGGCVVDLGIHLVDAALWMLDFPEITEVRSRLFHRGQLLPPAPTVNEDHAVAELMLANGAVVRLACSWYLPAGRPAIIEISAWGSEGGAGLRNVDGSFYDFVAEHWRGTGATQLAAPPDAWGGRAAVAWARALAEDPAFDPEIERGIDVARALDRVYGR